LYEFHSFSDLRGFTDLKRLKFWLVTEGRTGLLGKIVGGGGSDCGVGGGRAKFLTLIFIRGEF
jgi:hypothetical protein